MNHFFLFLYLASAVSLELHEPPSKEFTKHQSAEEAKYMKYHKCKDTGEAYGAAYFITKEHLLKNGIHKYAIFVPFILYVD